MELEEMLVSIQIAAEGMDETVNAITCAQEKAYKAIVGVVEHRRKLNALSLQEEIASLERIKAEYAHTAQQVMDIDERIYAAREKLRTQEENQLTKLHGAVMDALSERYEQQRQAEQRRIDESSEAWTKWSQETCGAIQAQMDALDAKEKAEDRAATAAEKTRRIDRIRQQMQYETDAYNLRQLEKQLEKAQADWADTQEAWEKSDQRSLLSAQMDAVREKAQTQLEALRAQSEQIDALYAQLTQSERLSQEAKETMLGTGQTALAQLIARYLGADALSDQSFGEMYHGLFASALGNVSGWFASMESALAGAKTGGTNAGGAAIEQTVIFNVPVESPGDVARRMEEVNLALLQML